MHHHESWTVKHNAESLECKELAKKGTYTHTHSDQIELFPTVLQYEYALNQGKCKVISNVILYCSRFSLMKSDAWCGGQRELRQRSLQHIVASQHERFSSGYI